MSEALYRKYRPQIFEDVVGQEHIERTIKNAIEQDKVSHAYLFTGPRGTGKTTTARLLAKALLCEHGPTPEPDGTCDDCVMIANGEHPDVYELDAASRTGVENVREEIIGRVQFAPTRGRYKIYIIDEVHMLSTAAFNALLKTLEEPPSHVVFILATTDPQKVPETIHSRCQRFDFRRLSAEAMVSRLGAICVSEDVEFEGEALDLIAHRAEGGMRNALTSLEQLIAFGEGKVTLEVAERLLGGVDTNDLAEIVRAIGARDIAGCFRWTAEYVETGADLAQFTRDLAEHVRNMYVMSLVDTDVALEVGEAERRELAQELPLFGPDRLARLLGVLGDLSAELKTSTNPRLSFEIALTRMVRPDSDLTLAGLAERIEALEAGHSAVAHVTSTAAPRATAQNAAQVVPTGSSASAVPMSAEPPVATPAVPTQPLQPSQVAPSAQAMSIPEPVPASAAQAPVVDRAEAPSVVPTQSPTVSQATPAVHEGVSAPTPVSAASSQLTASLQNPAALQRIWQAALATLKKNKAAHGVLFLNTKAIYDEARSLFMIEFPAENTFAFKTVQKPDVRAAVAEALAHACGESLEFAYTQAGSKPSAAGSSAPAAAAAAAVQPAVAPAPSAASVAAVSPVAPAAPAVAPASPAPVPTTAPVPVAPPPVSVPPAADDMPPYDDIPPYDDEVVPYDDPAPAVSAPAAVPAAPRVASASASPASTTTPAPAVSASTHAPSTQSSAGKAPGSPDDLRAILEAGFGGGVEIEEVNE